jgi:hypothetical protein
MIRVIWAKNETVAFRHYFHYYAYMGEYRRLIGAEAEESYKYAMQGEYAMTSLIYAKLNGQMERMYDNTM